MAVSTLLGELLISSISIRVRSWQGSWA